MVVLRLSIGSAMLWFIKQHDGSRVDGDHTATGVEGLSAAGSRTG